MINFFSILFGLLIAGWLFFALISGVGKSFQDNHSSSIDSASIQAQSKESIEETRRQQRQMMDDLKQKIKDAQRH